jgi:hypothetical protein
MSGIAEITALQQAEFSEQEIQSHVQQKTNALIDGGFNSEEVNNYFGRKEPNTEKIEQFWKEGIKESLSPEDLQLFNDNNTNDIDGEKNS